MGQRNIKINGTDLRATPVTMKVQRDLAPRRAKLVEVQMRFAALMVELEALEPALEGDGSPESQTPDAIRQRVADVTTRVKDLNEQQAAIEEEMNLASLEMLTPILQHKNGDEVTVEWLVENLPLDELKDVLGKTGVVRPTGATG